MQVIELLKRGYFPKELPNPLNTVSFADAVAAPAGALPGDLNANTHRKGAVPTAKLDHYSHARGGLLRRHLSIPNPVLHYLLCREIVTEWQTLQPLVGGTPISATHPVARPQGRAAQGSKSLEQRRECAAEIRSGKRYLLRADVSRCYPSIYTHSIPWALHTKATAKANRSLRLFGNRLDTIVRNSQDGQTIGIPIGPDTSLILAELIMQRCDEELLRLLPQTVGFRYIDDFELGFQTRTEAENAISALERVLGEYGIALNTSKTHIVDLPTEIEDAWIGKLRTFFIRSNPSAKQVISQRHNLYDYFNLAFQLAQTNPDAGVLQYAVARLRTTGVHADNWRMFQELLLGVLAPEPATIKVVLEAIVARVNAGMAPLVPQLRETLDRLIIDHAPVNHSSEVAWSLWGCLALGLPVSQNAVAALAECDDSIVGLLSLHARDAGRLAGQLDTTQMQAHITQNGLMGEHWLLAYEASIKGWLQNANGVDIIATRPEFDFLRRQGVSFYDAAQAVPAAPGGPAPVPQINPAVNLEGEYE